MDRLDVGPLLFKSCADVNIDVRNSDRNIEVLVVVLLNIYTLQNVTHNFD